MAGPGKRRIEGQLSTLDCIKKLRMLIGKGWIAVTIIGLMHGIHIQILSIRYSTAKKMALSVAELRTPLGA